MATDVNAIRAELAEHAARREAQRLSPSFMDGLRERVDGWRALHSEEDDRQRTSDEWVAILVRKIGQLPAAIGEMRIDFEHAMLEIAATVACAHRAQYPDHLLREWEDEAAHRAGRLERNRA